MNATQQQRHAFSLLELLVVTAIIVVLIALLLTVAGRVRKMARSADCQARLQQWGQAFQMYLNGNNGRPFSEAGRWWWVPLGPYHGSVRESMLCPEAREPRPGPPDPGQDTYKSGRATLAYDNGNWRGSYGMNIWVFDYRPLVLPQPIRFPARQAERIPLLADCADPWAWVEFADVVPRSLDGDEDKELSVYCLDRHAMAVNVVFLDGHAERVPLAGLWKLKWAETFQPREVTVPRP